MYFGRNAWLMAALLVVLPCPPARAQTPEPDFIPEFNAYVGLSSNVRFVFQAKEALDGGDLVRAQLGPSLDFYVKPLKALKDVTLFDLDELKCMPFVLSIGYRYLPSPVMPTTNRMEPVATFHFPVKGRILISDRNRADLDWSKGSFNWRYRNRLTVERRFTIHSYHPRPYASAEALYESKYAKWGATHLYAGCLLPLGKHFQLDPYYEHENNTGKRPNQQVDAGGLMLNLYFPTAKK